MGYLKEVNIKYDMPTADQAVKRTTYAIENGRRLGAACNPPQQGPPQLIPAAAGLCSARASAG